MGQNQNNEHGTPKDLGERIGKSVRDALNTGDLSHLKDIGAAVQDTVHQTGDVVRQQVQQTSDAVRGQVNGQQPVQQQKPPMQRQGKVQKQETAYQYNYNYAMDRRQANLPAAMRSKRNFAGVGQIVLGGVGAGISGITAAVFAVAELLWLAPGLSAGLAAGFMVPFAGCVGLLVYGIKKHGYIGRLQGYQRLLEAKNVMALDELATATGLPAAKIKKDIRKGLKKGDIRYFYFDKEEKTVMLGENTYHLYQQSEETRLRKIEEEKEREKRLQDPSFAEAERLRAEGAQTLRKIREANDALPGDEISQKLQSLEDNCARIFAFLEKYPQKIPDARRFMEYYLPTTLKLVAKYHEFEQMEVQTPSILESKTEIEQALDTINDAFATLLDDMFRDDTLDISTDIEVLQKQLEAEGLVGKKFDIDATNQPGTTLRF